MLTLRRIAPLAATVALAALPATVYAGPGGPAGSYAGYAVHEKLPEWAPLDTEPYESRLAISISRYRGGAMRLTGLAATIRTFCPDPAVRDVRIAKIHFRGPKVGKNGSFAYRTQGISFEGQARNGWLEGYASGGNQECSVEGVRFRLKRQQGR